MSALNWTLAISVGVGFIDYQHKKLFEHINNFYINLTKNPGKENLASLLKSLTDYTVYLFSTK